LLSADGQLPAAGISVKAYSLSEKL